MLYTLASELRDPVKIMLSFQETLRTLSVYKAMEYIRVEYVDQMVKAIDAGSVSVLFSAFGVTTLLFGCAVLFYFFANYLWARVAPNK